MKKLRIITIFIIQSSFVHTNPEESNASNSLVGRHLPPMLVQNTLKKSPPYEQKKAALHLWAIKNIFPKLPKEIQLHIVHFTYENNPRKKRHNQFRWVKNIKKYKKELTESIRKEGLAKSNLGNNIFHIACYEGDLATVRALLEIGIKNEINTPTTLGNTPLDIAAGLYHQVHCNPSHVHSIVQSLQKGGGIFSKKSSKSSKSIELKADLTYMHQEIQAHNSLHMRALCGWFINHYSDNPFTDDWDPATALEIILEYGANPNDYYILHQSNENYPILYHMIYNDNIEAVKILIDYGVDLEYSQDTMTYKNANPVTFAASLGKTDMVTTLLNSDAPIEKFSWNLSDNTNVQSLLLYTYLMRTIRTSGNSVSSLLTLPKNMIEYALVKKDFNLLYDGQRRTVVSALKKRLASACTSIGVLGALSACALYGYTVIFN
jgi:ankyrin repeat protein